MKAISAMPSTAVGTSISLRRCIHRRHPFQCASARTRSQTPREIKLDAYIDWKQILPFLAFLMRRHGSSCKCDTGEKTCGDGSDCYGIWWWDLLFMAKICILYCVYEVPYNVPHLKTEHIFASQLKVLHDCQSLSRRKFAFFSEETGKMATSNSLEHISSE